MANVFSKISDAIFHPASGSDAGVVGIDFSSSAIKVVQIRQKDKSPVLQTYGELSFAPYVDETIGESVEVGSDVLASALGDILKEAKVTAKSAGVTIPLSASLINIIELPPGTSEDNLQEVVPIEARKYIPAEPEEVMLDWTLIGDEPTQGEARKVLVVAIHKETISRYKSAVAGTDLDIGFFEIEVFSSIRSTLDRGIEPVMLIDMGTSSTKVYIVEHGVVRGSHRIDQGGEDITRTIVNEQDVAFSQAEKLKRQEGLNGDGDKADLVAESAHNVLDHVFAQAQEIVSNYQEENATVVEEAVLTGGGAALSGMEETASELLKIEARRADPFSKLQTPEFLSATLTDIGPEFAVAIGAALRRLQER